MVPKLKKGDYGKFIGDSIDNTFKIENVIHNTYGLMYIVSWPFNEEIEQERMYCDPNDERIEKLSRESIEVLYGKR